MLPVVIPPPALPGSGSAGRGLFSPPLSPYLIGSPSNVKVVFGQYILGGGCGQAAVAALTHYTLVGIRAASVEIGLFSQVAGGEFG